MLFASPFSIEDKERGTTNEGISTYFLMDDNMQGRIDTEAAARGQEVFGLKATKMNMPIDVRQKIRNVPGFYDCTLKMTTKRVTAHGVTSEVPSMQVVDIDFVGAVDAQIKEMQKSSNVNK